MKMPFFGARLSAEAFAEHFVQELAGRAPDLEIRVLEGLTLRMTGRDRRQQWLRLDRAFAQYQENPRELPEIVSRWSASTIELMSTGQSICLDAVVPLIKGHRWVALQRTYHIEQFGNDSAFSLCWEAYNAELIVVYAELKSGLRFLGADEVKANSLDMETLRAYAISNLRQRTKERRVMGGGDQVLVICSDGNLEPSLILLEDFWLDPCVRVEGERLVTIAERGFAISCGSDNLSHIWQIAADAAQSYRKAQYPVSPHLFQQRGSRFEVADVGDEDTTHPIVNPAHLDVRATLRGGGSDLKIIIPAPLQTDPRSIYRLFQKIDNYLQYINSEAYQKECGVPNSETTRIIVCAHPKTDIAIFQLLNGVGDWVKSRNASLTVERLDSIH
jgi:hypothetical protein